VLINDQSNDPAPAVIPFVLSPQMRDAVRRVAEHFPTAIVSGRCRDKVHYSDSKNHSSFSSSFFFLFKEFAMLLALFPFFIPTVKKKVFVLLWGFPLSVSIVLVLLLLQPAL
jgi:hypothetical protein